MFDREVRRLFDELNGLISETDVLEIRSLLEHDEPGCAWDLLWACLSEAKAPLARHVYERFKKVGSLGRQDVIALEHEYPMRVVERV